MLFPSILYNKDIMQFCLKKSLPLIFECTSSIINTFFYCNWMFIWNIVSCIYNSFFLHKLSQTLYIIFAHASQSGKWQSTMKAMTQIKIHNKKYEKIDRKQSCVHCAFANSCRFVRILTSYRINMYRHALNDDLFLRIDTAK